MLKNIITKIKAIEEYAPSGFAYKDGKFGLIEQLEFPEIVYLINLFYKYDDDTHPAMIVDNEEEFKMLGNTPKKRLLTALEVLSDLES